MTRHSALSFLYSEPVPGTSRAESPLSPAVVETVTARG
jgi:hypothetical protein